jgi:unsaturated chondroitin disaccharide hydrolase
MIQFVLDTDRDLLESSFRFAQHQVRKLIETYPDFYPMYTINGRWKHEGATWTHWCDGFLPGMMWVFHKRANHGGSEANFWMEQAIRYTKPLEPRKDDHDVHDLGFIFMCTHYRWYQITHDPALRAVVIEAARTLSSCFQEKGQYLRSFVGDDSLFIDMMMNVGIIFYAARETNDRKLRDIALRHCLTTRRVLVRGDGSTAQEGIFDLNTGEFLRQTTQQGYRGDSCWSRGLAWALYGFAACYEFSRDLRFLEIAEQSADYYISHTASDGVPPWDFTAPADRRNLLDSSAAAIAASGLLRMHRLVHDSIKGQFYFSTALLILRTLCQKHLAKSDKKWEGILKGGVYHIHRELGVDESVMWGEYFFVEALENALRLLQ